MVFLLQNSNASSWLIETYNKIQTSVLESITGIITSIFGRLPFILSGIIVLVLFWLLSKGVKAAFMAASGRTRMDKRLRILFSRMLFIFVLIVGIFTSLTVVIPSFTFGNVIAGLGFTSFVVGFATKDILNNFLSGVLILWQQPFRIGDHIFIGNNQGKVEYIGVRATSLRKDDGELVLIPNGDMYSSALTIRGAGANRRMKLEFSIGYEAEIAGAKTHIHDALHSIGRIVDDPEERIVVTDLTADGVNIAVYYWINTNENRPMDVFDEAATAIKESLLKAGIEIYPPGSVIVQRPKEEPEESEPLKRKSAI
jgi:small-conductance mechanosensitive channel